MGQKSIKSQKPLQPMPRAEATGRPGSTRADGHGARLLGWGRRFLDDQLGVHDLLVARRDGASGKVNICVI